MDHALKRAGRSLRWWWTSRVAHTLDRTRLVETMALVAPCETDRPLIRLGGQGDGGYLVPDDLEGIAACFSPGVAETAGFESALAERGIPSFMIDGSVEKAPVEGEMFDFAPLFLGPKTEDDTISLADWVCQKAPEGDLLLQMDIEGAEWAVLEHATPELLKRFRIMVIEFHGLHRLTRPKVHVRIRRAFEKIARGHVCVHAHGNNASEPVELDGISLPKTAEFTFIRRDRVRIGAPVRGLPHPLDAPNWTERPEIILPPVWGGPGGED